MELPALIAGIGIGFAAAWVLTRRHSPASPAAPPPAGFDGVIDALDQTLQATGYPALGPKQREGLRVLFQRIGKESPTK